MSEWPGVRRAHSTVADGNMSPLWGDAKEASAHQAAFLAKHGLRREDTVTLSLMHDDVIEVAGADARGTAVRTEALLTAEPGLVLMLMTADCNPISFYDPTHRAIALGHLSWQTTTLNLAEKVVSAMQGVFGSVPAELFVDVGPSARKESYIQPVVQQKEHHEWAPFLSETERGTAIDVLGYNIAQLTRAGVRIEHISINPVDTILSADYYSHYRSVRTGEVEGRFATVLALV